MSKETTTFTTIAAHPGWFFCELDRQESGDPSRDELAYNPIVAWEIEIETSPHGRLRTAHPISLESENELDPVLKSPDGQFISPCVCSFKTAAEVILHLQKRDKRDLSTPQQIAAVRK
jgi:hypothetical protein